MIETVFGNEMQKTTVHSTGEKDLIKKIHGEQKRKEK